MGRTIRLGELLVGTEGAALFRLEAPFESDFRSGLYAGAAAAAAALWDGIPVALVWSLEKEPTE